MMLSLHEDFPMHPCCDDITALLALLRMGGIPEESSDPEAAAFFRSCRAHCVGGGARCPFGEPLPEAVPA